MQQIILSDWMFWMLHIYTVITELIHWEFPTKFRSPFLYEYVTVTCMHNGYIVLKSRRQVVEKTAVVVLSKTLKSRTILHIPQLQVCRLERCPRFWSRCALYSIGTALTTSFCINLRSSILKWHQEAQSNVYAVELYDRENVVRSSTIRTGWLPQVRTQL